MADLTAQIGEAQTKVDALLYRAKTVQAEIDQRNADADNAQAAKWAAKAETAAAALQATMKQVADARATLEAESAAHAARMAQMAQDEATLANSVKRLTDALAQAKATSQNL